MNLPNLDVNIAEAMTERNGQIMMRKFIYFDKDVISKAHALLKTTATNISLTETTLKLHENKKNVSNQRKCTNASPRLC